MKNTIVIIALLSVFLLSGCTQNTTRTGNAFIGGTEGLRASFLPGTPPDSVFDNSGNGFTIAIKLQNVGESTIAENEGYIKINGLEPYSFGTTSFKKPIPEIRGSQKHYDGTIVNGGITTVEFGDLKYVNSIQGNIEQKFTADICYKYSTNMTTLLCVKRNAEQLVSDNKICDVGGEKGPQNSGGPVQVKSLTENFAGNGKIAITMTIAHEGTGDGIYKYTKPECVNPGTADSDIDVVYIKFNPVKIGNRDVYPQCQSLLESTNGYAGFIRLYDVGSGKKEYPLYCTLETGTTNDIIQVPISAELKYMYLQHLEKTIVIKHALS